MFVKKEIDIRDLDELLWGEAKKKWLSADEEQQEEIWEIINEAFDGDIASITDVNDFIWFECDDIFYGEDNEEEDLEDNDYL